MLPAEGSDGFDLGFDGGALPDAHLVLVDRVLGLGADAIVERLVRRLFDRQLADGGWALAPGLGGHVSTTVDAYVALRSAGVDAQELPLARARRFVAAAGGLERVGGPTQVTLALLGLHPWPETLIPPPELALLPAEAPLSLFTVGALLRLHLLPLVVLRSIETVVAPELGRAVGLELGAGGPGRAAVSSPGPLRGEALAACVDLMVERLDEDGSLGGLLLATGWAALAARALELPADHPLRADTARGLRSFVFDPEGRGVHVQVCRPTVRATALALGALRAAGASGEAVERGRDALLAQRAGEHGDFELLGPSGPVHAWSIKPRSRRFPSLLDTVLAASALGGLDGVDAVELRRALAWVADMQRPDGGFALFDRDASTAPWLRRLPLGLLVHTLNDESSPQVTGRALELTARQPFLGASQIERAVTFMSRSQGGDGSWRGPFSLGFLPATSAALAGLAASGARARWPIRKAIDFLLERQRVDGGWGESPESVELGGYVDIGRSSPAQTGMALTGLLAARPLAAPTAAERAVDYLLWTQEPDGHWVADDPCAASLTGVLHLASPVDAVAWPLLALGAFRDALESGSSGL
jgi:squalene-hopene/tetraprenyl-beta-curcumene cyclase